MLVRCLLLPLFVTSVFFYFAAVMSQPFSYFYFLVVLIFCVELSCYVVFVSVSGHRTNLDHANTNLYQYSLNAPLSAR